MLVQQVSQASHRHLQNLSSTSLVSVCSMQRSNDVVLFELRKITFEVDPVLRQIQIGHRSRLVLEYPLGKPFGSDSTLGLSRRRSIVFASSIETRDPAVLESNCALDCVFELSDIARPVVRFQIAHRLF